MLLFELSETKVDPNTLYLKFNNPTCGALICFDGRVRNHHQGQAVNSLYYEAYTMLANTTGHNIVEQAIQRFSLTQAYCIHRVGHLNIGDIAVWIGVSSAHRDDAFAGCRFIIDTIKAEVPIWKKEIYVENKEAIWLANAEAKGVEF